MDNNFYNVPRERRRVTENKKSNSFMTRVILMQMALSLVITGLLFVVCRNESALSQNIKTFYSELCKKDIAVSQIFNSVKNVVEETFSPDLEVKENIGETESTTGEEVSFSPVFLTVNFENPLINGEITSKFGYRISPITNQYSLHKGLDMSASENAEIYAAYNGVVLKAKYNEINGNYVVIKHSNSLKTTYNHCNKLLVSEGDYVKKGEKIALVGATGYATGNHLHFEVILNGKYINPLYVLTYGF